MKNGKRRVMLATTALAAVMLLGKAWGEERPTGPPGGKPKGPPPEAIAACKGKSDGDTVQFTTPRGDTLKGTCTMMDGQLAAMPAKGSMPRPDGPPPGN